MQGHVGADLCLLGLVRGLNRVLFEALVEPPLEVGHSNSCTLGSDWHEAVDTHGLHQQVTHLGIPVVVVVIVLGVEDRRQGWENLGCVGLDEGQDKGGVEELGHEDTVGDLGYLL